MSAVQDRLSVPQLRLAVTLPLLQLLPVGAALRAIDESAVHIVAVLLLSPNCGRGDPSTDRDSARPSIVTLTEPVCGELTDCKELGTGAS